MFSWRIYQHKSLFGLVYTFEKRGDGIGMHDHPEDQKHNIIVLKGSFQVYGPAKAWCYTLNRGDMMDLPDEHHPHELVALEDGSEFLGLSVNGAPSSYDPEMLQFGVTRGKEPTIPLT